MARILLILCILSLSLSVEAQHVKLSKNAKVSILTCDKGAQLYSLYGHTALRISDSIHNLDVIYNYGTFNFNTPNFYLKFIKGDLQYFVTTNNFEDFMSQYTYENRAVYEQIVFLTAPEKQALFENLNANLVSEERFYTYKYIDRNCTTMIIEKLNSVISTNKIPYTRLTELTYREILYGYQKDLYFENLGINIIFGSLVDNNGGKIFLPKDLMTTLNSKPEISSEAVAINTTQTIETPFSIWNNVYFFSFIMLFIAFFSSKKWVQIGFLAIMGLMGTFFSIVGLYSFHKEVLWNYNVMLFNPLFLVLIYFTLKNKTHWSKKLSITCLFLLVVYTFYMFTKVHLLLVLPIVITTFIILFRSLKKLIYCPR